READRHAQSKLPTRNSAPPARGVRRTAAEAMRRSLSHAVVATTPGRKGITTRQIRYRRDMASLRSSKGCESASRCDRSARALGTAINVAWAAAIHEKEVSPSQNEPSM